MAARRLSLIETTRFGVPLGGRWFRAEEAVVAEHSKRPGFLIAWDIPHKARIFGIYQGITLDELSRCLDRVPAERRYGYQMLLHTQDCPGYMVLQWKGKLERDHETLREALRRLSPRCYSAFAQKPPDIVSYCNTRTHPARRHALHSYIVIVKNMVFSNNHDGFMRAFFKLGMPEINLDVYAPNHQLLLPNCRTFGSGTPLTRLDIQAPLFRIPTLHNETGLLLMD
jgi:hypothetical protein